MNRIEKEKRIAQVLASGDKTEEGRLKIVKIEKYRDNSYDYKINAIFWAALTAFETIMRYVTSDKALTSLVPTSLVPLVAFLFQKIRVDRKIYHLEEEILNSKTK